MNLRDAWFIVALIFVTILAFAAPRFAGAILLLVAVYIAIGPLHDKGFFRRV